MTGRGRAASRPKVWFGSAPLIIRGAKPNLTHLRPVVCAIWFGGNVAQPPDLENGKGRKMIYGQVRAI